MSLFQVNKLFFSTFGSVVLSYIEIQRIWGEKKKGDGCLRVIYM